MIANRKFFREDVLVDGEKFVNCQFTESRIVFRALEPAHFDKCTFTNCEWVFDGPAENMLFFLAALATSLGEETRSMVINLLNGVASGELHKVMRHTNPPIAV